MICWLTDLGEGTHVAVLNVRKTSGEIVSYSWQFKIVKYIDVELLFFLVVKQKIIISRNMRATARVNGSVAGPLCMKEARPSRKVRMPVMAMSLAKRPFCH